jgi:hypothetical protein
MGEMKNAYRMLIGKSEGKSFFVHLGVDGRITL